MDRIGGIPVFVQVVDSGSYVAAARALGQTASSVGKTIARLEEQLGVRLFHRNTRSISLTAEGARFLVRCRTIMGEISAAESDFALARESPQGRLRVSVPLVSSAWHSVFTKFMERYPDIDLELSFTNRNVDLIEEGFEAVLRIGSLEDSRLRTRKIGSFRLLLVASPSYLAQRSTPECLDDLAGHICLRSRNSSTRKLYPWPLGPDFLRRSDQLVNRLVTDHNAMLLTAALSGHGIACVPEFWAHDHVLSQELVVLLEAATGARRTVSALWPMGPPLPKTSAFVDFMAVRLAPVLEPGGLPEKADLAD
jgi:DNA-binding transcriptional LysR family regulator